MLTSLEKKNLEMQIAKIKACRLEHEYIREQKLAEIARIDEQIKIQQDKESELELKKGE
jgi:hypothetical protein